MKKIAILLGVLILLTGCSSSKTEVKEINFEGKTIVHQGQDFKGGQYQSILLNNSGNLELKKGSLEGSYTSPIINTNTFRELIASWNSITPKDTQVELFVQVRKEGEWSEWFSYGKWSSEEKPGSVKGQRDKMANMAIDTLTLLGGREAEALRYKVDLYRKDSNVASAQVSLVAVTLKLSAVPTISKVSEANWTRDLDVPERSQMVVPKIGNSICSPTSVSMVMEYYGKNLDTALVAERARDYGAGIYGNWSFNVAYAGSQGLAAYIDRYYSIEEIKEKISQGIPVIASITTGSQADLKGSPMAYPSGHLLVVRGFVIRDGEEYVIVNDPAAPDHDSVRREYKLSEFEKAWKNIVYIISQK